MVTGRDLLICLKVFISTPDAILPSISSLCEYPRGSVLDGPVREAEFQPSGSKVSRAANRHVCRVPEARWASPAPRPRHTPRGVPPASQQTSYQM